MQKPSDNSKKKPVKRSNIILDIITENENISGANCVSKNAMLRLYVVLIVILCCYFILIFRMIDVSLIEVSENKNIPPDTNHNSIRGDIVDRNGVILAINLPTNSLYAKPDQIIDVEKAARLIANISVQYSKGKSYEEIFQNILSKLKSNKNFVWIKRHVLPDEYAKIRKLGILGLYFFDDYKRFYPYESTFAHVVCFVDIDGNGIAGIEKYYDKKLSKGEKIILSIDSRVQAIVRDSLYESIIANEALGGMALIMDANNGEIISMVSLPDFNPNGFEINQHMKRNPEAMFNKATLGVYEMGSTFKILTLAMGLDTNVVNLNDSFNVEQPIKLGKYKVKDYSFKKPYLSLAEVLIFSSNIGIIQIGQKIGLEKQQEYMRKIGMLSPVNIEMYEVGKPLHVSQKQWNDIYLATISYGHGIAVTGLHTAKAIASVVNGGFLVEPTMIKRNQGEIERIRVFKDSTSKTIRSLMRRVVEEGYSKKADVPGYNVGGKTGTAEKVKQGKYVKKNCNLALFMGAFPIDDPQYVILVAIDEAKPNKNNNGYTTGGWVAAPAASKIIRNTAHLLGVEPR